MCSSVMKYQYLLPGEHDNNSKIVYTHGINQKLNSSKQILDSNFLSIPRIYEPKDKDCIIGIVIVRAPDLFLVDINSSESAVLPQTSFDNGCLPTRNAMGRLSVVYAHVVRTDLWTQIELSCKSLDNSKKRNDFGLLEQGHIIRCSLRLCEKLKYSQLINKLKSVVKNLRLHIAVNGFVWFTTDDTINSMIAVKNVICKHEYENNIDQLIEFYLTIKRKLEQEDKNIIQVKQQKPIVKKDVKKENIEQSITSDALTRVFNEVIKSILETIICKIENNENK